MSALPDPIPVGVALRWPGWHESAPPDDITAMVEAGADFVQWPCWEWNWAAVVRLQRRDGSWLEERQEPGWDPDEHVNGIALWAS